MRDGVGASELVAGRASALLPHSANVGRLPGLDGAWSEALLALREVCPDEDGRLEREYGWLKSEWEDPDISIAEGRPRRRYYQLSRDGAEAARLAIAESYQARHHSGRNFGGKTGPAGVTS